eukprot:TRINITY_DN76058_c0_g1_i1.p1 TRINITY_DN76058_c0_g1~~TRINITY_DN76058_c0_g1_i1.p1  ORF type:complete len:459 (-),score=82.37 TRINITY_DN76058_c0_g1_i1:9-1385(-)
MLSRLTPSVATSFKLAPTVAAATKLADVLVVGAGPAGIASVLSLRGLRVVWVDPEFDSGRLGLLKNVPCNSKVDLLNGNKFFRHPLFDSVASARNPALDKLIAEAYHLPTSRDPSALGWTNLGACKGVFDAATAAILTSGDDESSALSRVRGRVQRLSRSVASGEWLATVSNFTTPQETSTEEDGGDIQGAAEFIQVRARCVVLATGVEPKVPQDGKHLSSEVAFDPEALHARLRPGDAVAVIGHSHSAAVALANLSRLVDPLQLQLTIVPRTLKPARLAEWVPELGSYRYTSSGLKGASAVFGEAVMTGPNNKLDSLDVVPLENFDPESCRWLVDCTGYVPSSLPWIVSSDANLGERATDLAPVAPSGGTAKKVVASGTSAGVVDHPTRDRVTGRLVGFQGLFGLGAAWGETPGVTWGQGMEEVEGFKNEYLIGFHVFFTRATMMRAEIDAELAACC